MPDTYVSYINNIISITVYGNYDNNELIAKGFFNASRQVKMDSGLKFAFERSNHHKNDDIIPKKLNFTIPFYIKPLGDMGSPVKVIMAKGHSKSGSDDWYFALEERGTLVEPVKLSDGNNFDNLEFSYNDTVAAKPFHLKLFSLHTKNNQFELFVSRN